MLGTSPLIVLAIAWGVVTAVFIGLVIWRSMISMREDDQLFIDSADSSLAAEQTEIQARLKRISPFTKTFGATSIILLLVIGGVWVHQIFTRLGAP